jgi:hypothetical protein
MGLIGNDNDSVLPEVEDTTTASIFVPKTEEEDTISGRNVSDAYKYQLKCKQKIREGAKKMLANPEHNFSLEERLYLEWLARNPGEKIRMGSPTFQKLFGELPEVGASITLQEAFNRTFKSKAQLDQLMKKTMTTSKLKIEFIMNRDKPAESVYKVVSVG